MRLNWFKPELQSSVALIVYCLERVTVGCLSAVVDVLDVLF
jgi:hypothetical protein